MAVTKVQLAGRSYEVHIGKRLLSSTAMLAGPLVRKRTIAIIADVNARALHGPALADSFKAAGLTVFWFDVPSGESSKSWSGLQALTDWMLDLGIERGDYVIALGGGVVGDLTGFACSIVKRGCGFIQIPTTLLAQVDSSVGGKTAINTRAGKNLIGAFHQPSLVIADTDTLKTLPLRDMQAGYAEVIKYGILGDREFFEWCETHGGDVVAGDDDALQYAVSRSVEAKAQIVAEDERETTGVRALLNLGHTFGHALEAETGYSDKLLHGEAVALGMVLAARYSARLGYISSEDAERVAGAIAASGLRSEIASLDLECSGQKLADHMRHDKKMDSGTLPFILLRSIGAAFLDHDVSLVDVAAFLDEQLQIN